MKTLIQILVAPALMASFLSNSILAFQENLEEFIERDSAGFIVIEEPGSILEQFESSAFFQNRHFRQAMEFMIDGDFPLMTSDRLNELESKWFDLRETVSRLDEISVIIHTWPESPQSIPKFSIALSGSPKAVSRLQNLLTDAEDVLLDSDPENDHLSMLTMEQLAGISLEQVGDIILLSNAPQKFQELKSRIKQSTDKKFNSLARYRSYMQIQKLLDKRTENPQIRGFLAPKSFRHLMTNLVADKQVLTIDPPESIASAGFQIRLQNNATSVETQNETFQPMIDWDFVLTYTQPSSGFGKLIESFKPFDEFPAVPFGVTSLQAVGFDLAAKREADMQIFEKYQKKLFAMDFEKYFQFSEFGLFGTDEDLNVSTFLNSTDAAVSVYHESNPIHWKAALEIKRVKDREAMEILLAEKIRIANANSSGDERIVEIPNDHGRLFGRTEKGIREILMKQAKVLRENGEEPLKDFDLAPGDNLSEQVLSSQYEYFINDDWMIHCDHNSMKTFLKSTYEEIPESSIFDLLLDHTRQASGQSEFFKITYQSNKHYKVKAKRMQNSIESLRIKEKYGSGPNDQSSEIWKRLMASPDEFGLRNEIESHEDAVAAVQQLMLNAFHDTFGTVVSLYSRDEHKMRIYGQVYSLIE